MANQKVCDGCGHTCPSRDVRGSWARLFVPTASLWPLPSAASDGDTPEYDLCPNCFGSVQSLLSLFTTTESETKK